MAVVVRDGDQRTSAPTRQRSAQRSGGWRQIAATLTLLMLAGCGRDPEAVAFEQLAAKVTDGSAQRELQAYFDKHPQCAIVLDTDERTGLLTGEPDNASTRALLSAGLIERVDGVASSPMDIDDRFYQPTAQARKWFRKAEWALRPKYTLCFAKREVRDVWVAPKPSGPINYSFLLLDEPTWMKLPVIENTFVEARQSLSSKYIGNEYLRYNKGSLTRDQMFPTHDYGVLSVFGVDFEER